MVLSLHEAMGVSSSFYPLVDGGTNEAKTGPKHTLLGWNTHYQCFAYIKVGFGKSRRIIGSNFLWGLCIQQEQWICITRLWAF